MSREMLKVINTVTKENLYKMSFEHSNYRPTQKIVMPRFI